MNNTQEEKKLIIEFLSDVSIDNGYTNQYLGKFKSTMELYDIELEEGKKGKVTEFDGVFDLPKQARKLLKLINITIPNSIF